MQRSKQALLLSLERWMARGARQGQQQQQLGRFQDSSWASSNSTAAPTAAAAAAAARHQPHLSFSSDAAPEANEGAAAASASSSTEEPPGNWKPRKRVRRKVVPLEPLGPQQRAQLLDRFASAGLDPETALTILQVGEELGSSFLGGCLFWSSAALLPCAPPASLCAVAVTQLSTTHPS